MRDRPENARIAALYRTIPKNFDDIDVGTSNGTLDLTKYRGQFIFLKALTVDVFVLLGKSIDTPGAGFPISTLDPAPQEFLVESTDPTVTLNHRAASACKLRIFYD
jgi:hypothetical protein